MQPTRLLNRNFLLLWQGQFVSRMGGHVYAIAIVLWLKEATGSATLVGLVMMLSGLPIVLLGAIGGTAADRLSRRAILLVTDLVRGLLVLSVAAALYFAPDATLVTTAWLIAVAVSMSAATAFFVPAISAAIPDLVPPAKLMKANSLRQLTAQTALLTGQAVGGALYVLLGAPILALANGISFLLSAASVAFVRMPAGRRSDAAAGRRAFRGDLVEGLKFVGRQQGLRQVFLFTAVFAFFTMPIIVLLPFYVDDHLGASPEWYGYLLATYTGGIMLGSVGAGVLRLNGSHRAGLMIAFAIVSSVSVGLLGLVRSLDVALTLALAIGVLTGFNGVNVHSITQARVASEMRGRVQGVLATVTGSLAPLGMGSGGLLYDLLDRDIALIFGGCGASMALLSIVVARNAAFRAFIGYEPGLPDIEGQGTLKQPST
ncbi:MAG: MFS transporter [Gammaproteobacteria bacterium]|nr:MFS transporter [Gammaproteobacteria bacterium]